MASRPDLDQTLDATRADRSFYGHPRGLATLFFTEMWERFCYYGMRAILILFMTAPASTGGLGFGVAKAGAVYGFYTAMVYLLSLPGGWVADRITGQRRAVLYGGILIAAGELCLTGPGSTFFYAGIILLMLGTGMLKPNVSTIVGQLYAPGDTRRDAGFSIFYMGINVGALIAPLICGYLGQRVSWRLGFAAAGFAMIAGLVQYVLGGKYLGSAGVEPSHAGDPLQDRRQKRVAGRAAVAVVGVVGLFAILGNTGVLPITAEWVSNALGFTLVLITLGVFSWLLLGKGWSHEERKRSGAILVLFLGSALFWSMFEQAGSSLNLFAQRNTNCNVLGFSFPASWFQFVQPFFVVSLAPVFAWIWGRLGSKEPPSPAKFAMGLISGTVAFLILVPAATRSGHGALVSMWWLIFTYLFLSIGELCLSPVGLSAMTKLAPARVGGFMMGVWFLSISIGDFLAGRAASVYESMPLPQLFGTVAAFGLGATVVIALLIKPTVRLMSGVK
jgi:proton-dependent oligopeptide transporter, POT family